MQTKYLFAESLGVFGGSLAFTALGLLLGLEGTPWALALLAALPYLTLPLDLLAGLLLDRLDRRTLLLVGVWLRAGILGLLAFLPKEPLFLLPLAFLFQAVLALDLPAWHALLVRLARDRLEREGGRLQAAQLLGDSLGDLLAAPLLLLAKPLPFALGGLLLAGGGLLLRDLPAYPPPRAAKGEGFTLGALFAGLAFLLGDGRLLPLTLYALAMSFLSGLALALLPLMALAQGAPPVLYGLYPWGLSIGGFLGSLLAGRIGPCLGVWGGHGLRILGLALLLLPFPFGPLGTFLAGVGGALVLRPGAYTVGRAEGCDLVVPDPGVSRQHVRVRRGPEGTELEDLGSTNGTYVNGLRVNRCRLRHGDRVRLGRVVLEYREVP